jgi:hypothetical protein
MTIFTSKLTEKKDDSDITSSEVSEYKLLVHDEKLDAGPPISQANGLHGSNTVAVAVVARRRHSMFRLYAMLLSLIILLIMILLGGIMIYVNFQQAQRFVQKYRGHCGVLSDDTPLMAAHEQEMQDFQEEITIDDMQHETIEVPNIGDTRRATVLHDFNKNVTAIIDREQSYCFIMPLNRTLVMPPRDFWDLLVKLKTGYYIPNVEVVRENYRALTPPLQDLTPYGVNIWNECHSFNSYRLVPEGEPIAISKRSAEWCEFAGEKWCLGDAGVGRMLCINVKGCI